MAGVSIGIDVGGTKIAAGVVDAHGRVLARRVTKAHSERPPQEVIDVIVATCRDLIANGGPAAGEITAVGVGFPSPIAAEIGRISSCSNLPDWCDVPLRDILAREIGLPVLLDNDAHLGAVGEHLHGAGKGLREMCYLCFSTGFGLGIILDGRLYLGSRGTAGELSHIVIDVDGPLCTCGKRGCLMTYASGIGIDRQVRAGLAAGEHSVLSALLPADGKRIGGEAVAQAAAGGDRLAGSVLHTAGYYFGVGISILVELLNPDVFVVGGGLTQIGSPLMAAVEEGWRANTQPELADSFTIIPARLGADVGVIGAAAEAARCLAAGDLRRFSTPVNAPLLH